MKKLCLILAYLFLFTQTVSAMPLLVGQKVVYRGTITDLRISAVDGTAFIDNAGATIPTYADGNHQIEIYDSSNRMLKGVLKAAGSSETLDTEKITGWTNVTSYSYETLTTSGANITEATETSTDGRIITNALGTSALALYKFVLPITINSGGNVNYPYSTVFCINNAASGYVYPNRLPSSSTYTVYATQRSSVQDYIGIRTYIEVSFAISNPSLKQVLTPSSSGATIVSAKGGETFNFSYKNASFTYNASSYYVIIRAIR